MRVLRSRPTAQAAEFTVAMGFRKGSIVCHPFMNLSWFRQSELTAIANMLNIEIGRIGCGIARFDLEK